MINFSTINIYTRDTHGTCNKDSATPTAVLKPPPLSSAKSYPDRRNENFQAALTTYL
jgi:hypothetical protein